MKCPKCKVNALKYGKTKNKFKFEKQRYICKYCHITFYNELENNFITVSLDDMCCNTKKDFKKFYRLLINDNIYKNDFKDLMMKLLNLYISNNISLKIIYYLFNQKVSLRTLQRIKKKMIAPIAINDKITFKIGNNVSNSKKSEIIFQEFLIKTYQITVKEIEYKDSSLVKRYEILDKDYLEKNHFEIDNALCITNLIKIFQKYKDINKFNEKDFFDELLSMYMLKPDSKTKSKKIKYEYLAKNIVKVIKPSIVKTETNIDRIKNNEKSR